MIYTQTPTDKIEAATTQSGSQNHATCYSAEPRLAAIVSHSSACPKTCRLQFTVTSIYGNVGIKIVPELIVCEAKTVR